jgi:putative transposase
MVVFLQEQGYAVDRKRVRRLMQLMGLETISPKPRLSLLGEQPVRSPYLLREMRINRRDQVWIGVYHLHPPGTRLRLFDGDY